MATRMVRWLEQWATALTFCYCTGLLVLLAAMFAVDFVALCREHPGSQTRLDWWAALAAWDGEWYVRIASAGYSYDPERMSSVAFFPLYPKTASLLVHGFGLRPEWALLIVSHGALVATFGLLAAYVQRRYGDGLEDLPLWTLLAFGLFPTTFWFRMTYSESTFLLLAVAALYGMQRQWRTGWIAVVIGLVTASRTVGVALVPVFWLYLWQQSATRRQALLRATVWTPVCVAGLAVYIAYQGWAFGDPLAFVRTQVHWNERPSMTLTEQIVGGLTLEPIRAVYDSSSSCYWASVPPRGNLLFNMKAANPVYFLATVGLVLLGWRKRWLDARELLLAAGLLAIPYFLQGTRTGMSSQARYAAVVFPVFYRVIRAMGAAHVRADTGDFRLLSRRAVDALLTLGESNRFLRGMVGWLGFHTEELVYDRAARVAGATKWPVRKMARLAADAIAGYTQLPLRLAYYLACGLSVVFLGYLGWRAVAHFVAAAPLAVDPGVLLLAVIAFGAANLLAQAVQGEYLGRLHQQCLRRPLYIVQERTGEEGGGMRGEG